MPGSPVSAEITGSNVRPVVVAVTPTIDTNAYASNDNIGTSQEIADAEMTKWLKAGLSVTLVGIQVADKSTQAAPMDVFLFESALAGGGNNNAAFDPDDADLLLALPSTPIHITDWVTNNDNALGRSGPIRVPIYSANDQNIYARAVSRGTPTYAVGDLTFRYLFELA